MTLWLDVEDLFHFIQSGNKRTSGIQRLTLEIYRAAEALSGGDGSVRFVRHGRSGETFAPVSWAEILVQFAPQESPPPALAAAPAVVAPAALRPRSVARRAARNLLDRLPEEVRRPMVLAAVMQMQAAGELVRFGANTVAHPARRLARRFRPGRPRLRAGITRAWTSTGSFDAEARPGDTLLVLGSPWFRPEYGTIARWLRDTKRMRFGVLVHDLVPIRRPEWSHIGVTMTFESWYSDVLPFCDLVLSNSRHTAEDVQAYAREEGITLPGPVRPLPIGAGFGLDRPEPSGTTRPDLPVPGRYVLFVSTMEARKNHALLVRVWKRLLDEVAAGRRDPDTVPDLVFAGRVGWMVADLLQQLENTAWLGGRVRMIHDPTDDDLRALYRSCLFTVLPSFHEGWGLPVSESLSFGKPCLCSGTTALPEAGGALCRYFDPESLESAYRALAAVLDDRAGLAVWEDQVRREYRPASWSDTARALLDAVATLEPPRA